MTEQELKKLSRADLQQLLLEQDKVMDQLRERIASMERSQREKAFQIKRFGSIAESSLQLSGVFEAAQQAADRYLEQAQQAQNAAVARKKEAEALLLRTRELCEKMEADTRRKCEAMTALAEEEAKNHWRSLEQDVIQSLERYVPDWEKDGEELAKLLGLDEEMEEEQEEAVEAAEEESPIPEEERYSYLHDLDVKYGAGDDEEEEEEEDDDLYEEYEDDDDDDDE